MRKVLFLTLLSAVSLSFSMEHRPKRQRAGSNIQNGSMGTFDSGANNLWKDITNQYQLALFQDDVETIQLILQNMPHLATIVFRSGSTPLHLVCNPCCFGRDDLRKRLEVLGILYCNGADKLAKNKMGQTPLMLLENCDDFYGKDTWIKYLKI